MSLLTVVQDACAEIGILKPNVVVSNTDQQIIQLLALANREGRELSARWPWQSLRKESSFTTVATESQGALSTIAPNARNIINNTIWNRDLRRPVFGPLTPSQWQQLKAQSMQGPWNQYVIRGDTLRFIPAPTAGQSCYFEYISKAWVLDADGSTEKTAWEADDDSGIIDEDLMTLGLIWRWKSAKGLTYVEDMATYERRVADAQGRDGTKQVVNLQGYDFDIFPSVVVPSGSWNV